MRLQACGAEGTVRHGGIRNGKRRHGPARAPAAARPFRFWWRLPSSSPTWSASASSPASAFRSRTSPPAFRSCCCGRSAASSRCAGCFPTASSARCFRARAASTTSSAGPITRPSVSWRAGCRRPSASPHRSRWPRWRSASTASRCLPDAPPLALAIGVVWLVSLVQLTGVRHSSTFQLIATILKVVLIVAFLVSGFVDRHAAAGLVRAVGFRLHPYRQRAVRDQPRVRDVFVLGLERGDLHHRRDAAARAQRAARDAGRER